MKKALLRSGAKTLLFLLLVLVVLNPNLKRVALQFRHIQSPESLVQTDFPGLLQINADIDDLLEAHPEAKETEIIEHYVYEKILYVTDYENWWNIEYWPTAEETWRKGQEDCDGRAILAASIMRSRGFKSARLVVGLDHMWVQVNENEKRRNRPGRVASLLHPSRTTRLELPKDPGLDHYQRLVKALMNPKAFRDTSGSLIDQVPVTRKFVLMIGLLALLFFPRKDFGLFLAIAAAAATGLALALTAVASAGEPFLEGFGLALIAVAILFAWRRPRMVEAI